MPALRRTGARARKSVKSTTVIALVAAILLGATGCERTDRSAPAAARPRVITLTPSASEIVAALGATDLLVGVDNYTTFPPETAALPRVGSFLTPDVEAILRLRPTLVVLDDIHAPTAKQLHDLGVATVDCPMHALEDVRAALTRVGERLGRAETARAVVAEIDRAVDEVGSRRHPERPRVLAVIDRAGGLSNLVAAGPGSWLDELLALVGAKNVLAGAPTRYPKLSIEEILRAAPDVIVDVSFGADPARAAEDWAPAARVPAVAHGRIAIVKAPYFIAPSPRIAQALAELEPIVYPAAP